MKRINVIIFAVFFLFLSSLTTANARDIELVTKNVKKNNSGEITIQFGVISNKNFDLLNVSICFKVLKEDVPVGCKEIKITVPKGSDGTDIKEAKIIVPENEKDLKLISTIFYSTRRYKIEEWFSDCQSF
ncbi:MAG: hypothetical protein PVG39_30520 [Desulfobacteraceae bacterium]